MATAPAIAPAPAPAKKAKKAREPLTKYAAATKITALCKRLPTPQDALKVLDSVRGMISLD